jgi:2-amino-4-hydroxy-6-hydroxymethyldihydropteridine diphosphokinase
VTEVYVAAGSNIDPVNHLRRALDELRRIYPRLTVSPAYRNKAVGFEGEDFVNLVVGFSTQQPVARVREQLQRIETLCGRPAAAPKWAARSMDLDILMYGDFISNEPGLVIPRPDLLRRPYMLKPMADVAPDVQHPLANKSMRELWESFDSEGHEMVEVPLTSPRSALRPPQ